MFGTGSADWVLVEDNDPKHRSQLCTNWKAENDVTVLPWPSHSPNQNPIKNIWHLLKLKIARKRIRKVASLKAAIVKEWNRLPQSLAQNLVYSLRNRILSVINNEGDYTLY